MGRLVIALRRDLHATLLRLANTDVRRGEVVRVDHDGDRVSIALADGSTDTGDLLIGADGVGSIVRRQLHPEEPAPAASGYSTVRGVAFGANDAIGGLDAVGYFGPGVEAGVMRAGSDAIYWYLSLLTSDLGSLPRDPQAVSRACTIGFEPRLLAVVARTLADDMRFDELFTRAPLASWGRGRMTLLGDAAHPVLPHTGQGAAQALEDAVALGPGADAGCGRRAGASPV
jgi:2-polyprenyl-6-methoxyphenol hydroxylase-like FAD-dependent oxidoreductase